MHTSLNNQGCRVSFIKGQRCEMKDMDIPSYNALSLVLDTLRIKYLEKYGSSLIPNAVITESSVVITLEAEDETVDPLARYSNSSAVPAGSFDLDTSAGTISVELEGHRYVFKPVDGVDIYDLYKTITAYASYSIGKAINFLKGHALGVRAEQLTRTNDVLFWRSTLESKHKDLTYRAIMYREGMVIKAMSKGRQVGSWRTALGIGFMESEARDYTNYDEFMKDVAKYHPTAQQVKDDNNGVILFIDGTTNTPVAHWNTTASNGTIMVDKAVPVDAATVGAVGATVNNGARTA